ncbi:hypothetical protein HDV00_009647 [Rhizophlyctis rosea]|nr:hypothetical protein HDV00_009647 [Rhizophlyctis rosea]
MHLTTILTTFLLVSTSAALPGGYSTPSKPGPKPPKSLIKCPIILDGRIAPDATLHYFDIDNPQFNKDYTKGANLTWSQILKLPKEEPSRFDAAGKFRSVEVTISDESIFLAGTQPQLGFRRAELLMGNGTDASNVGIKTFHWSVKQDPHRRLNLTHEYLNVWHETNAFDADQFMFNTGRMIDYPTQYRYDAFKVLNRKGEVVWWTPIRWKGWQNFALTVDYDKNLFKVYYSHDKDSLGAVTGWVPNDNSGGGQFHIGMLKKPTESKTIVWDGYQESHINEGQIYSGLFVEDSEGGCISL